jgi:tetratricopeptide (TPR) repeat protein
MYAASRPANTSHATLEVEPPRVIAPPSDTSTQPLIRRRRFWWFAAAVACLAAGAIVFLSRAPAADVTSVAILPIRSANDDPLARGLTEDITDALSRVHRLRVEPQSAAQATLEGEFERTDNRVRLVLHLNRTDGRHWERTLERPAGEMWAMALDAAAFLSPEARKRAPQHKPPGAAYEAYLEGRSCLAREDANSTQKAIECFERATNLDPDFALAWAWDSIARENLADAGAARPNETLPQARDAAERAVTMGAEIAEAHAALGIVRLQYDWDWEAASRELDRALALSPGLRVAHYWKARWLEAAGRAAPRVLRFANLPPHDDGPAARKLLDDADDIRVETYISPVALALVANSLHDIEGVFHWLDVAYDERCVQLPFAVWDPALPRNDPRMADLLQRMKLSATQ